MKHIMSSSKFFLPLLVASLALASNSYASDVADDHGEEKVMHVEKEPFGDVAAGKQKVGTCAACHGNDGNSTNADWPTLAGQHPEYTYEQLLMIKDGSRSAPLMVGQLTNKNDKDLKDIAAYYASQETKPGKASKELVDHGQSIFRGGNTETGVPACAACHGANGAGIPMSKYPAIAGQQPGYTLKALKDYASGARKGNAQQKIMKEVAALMSDEEKAAVADYIRGLQ